MKRCLFFIAIGLNTLVFSQIKNIQILDLQTLEPVVGAWVKCGESRRVSNENGMIIFQAPCSTIVVKHVSYLDSTFVIPKETKEVYTFFLTSTRTLSTIVIQAQRSVRIEPFRTSIDGKYIERFPTFLGQTDPFYIVQMQAGASPSQEGNVGFHVRGGEAFENMIRLDGAVVYNPQHLLGIVSPFNPAIINSVDFVKDGINASNGGKASSYVDFHTRKGNFTERETRIDLGMVNSGLVHSGYVIKDKLAYSISGRAGNLNAFSRWMDFKVSFYDIMTNLTWKINEKSRLDFTYFRSSDEFGWDSSFLTSANKTIWSNEVLATNYSLNLGKRTHFNANLSYSRMINKKLIQPIETMQDLSSWQSKAKWNTNFEKMYLSYGIESNVFRNSYQFKDTSQQKSFLSGEHALFVQADYIHKSWEFSMGNRLNFFQNYPLKENVWSNDIRLKALYQHRDIWNFYVAFDQLSQFNFLFAEGHIVQPHDFLMALDRRLGPIKTNSTSLGTIYKHKNLTIKSTLFYKDYSNFVDIKDGGFVFDDFNIQKNLTRVLKNSYGIESSIHWHWKSLDWMTNYTYSRTMLQADEINLGIAYPAAFDRPHIFNSTASWHKKNSKWKFGAAFYLMSGRRTSILYHDLYNQSTPSPLYPNRQIGQWIVTPRNSISLPMYHRLDLSGSKEFSHRNPKVKSFLNVSIYNVYNHMNVYELSQDGDEFDLNTNFLSLTLFPIIPSVSYSVRF